MSGGLLCVIPIISTTYADACVESLARPDSAAGLKPEELLIVDNSREGFCKARYGLETYRDPDGFQLGVPRSWNIGARRVLDEGLDYLVIMSSTMMFGPELQTTYRRQLESFWGAKVIEADGHSYHLIAFHNSVLSLVGLWDENLYPGYFEAEDHAYRMPMVGWEQGWIRIWCNAVSQSVGGHLNLVNCPADPLIAYMTDKWGGRKGEERYVMPWGDKPLDYWPEHTIPELAEKYGLGPRHEGWW